MEGKSVKSGMSVYELDLCCCEKEKVKEVESKEEEEEKEEKEEGKINGGVFACTCCGSKLFSTTSEYPYNEKYPRVPGVIEFTGVITRGSVTFVDENVYGIERVSFVCKKCGLNLGFIAIREEKDIVYCANPLCLRFVSEKEIAEESVEEKENGREEEEEVRKDVDINDKSVINQSKDDKKEEIEKERKKEDRNKKKSVGNKEKGDEKNQLSLPKVAVAFAGLLSVIGWAKFTNN